MIHPTALISPHAEIGEGVSIGAYSIVHGNVSLGAGTKIDAYCEIGYPTPMAEGRKLSIGRDSLIRSHSVFYEGSSFGDGLKTGHRVTVRELTQAGDALQIGTLSDIQGHCQIGHHVRTHSNVHIGQGSRIGNFVWLFPYIVLTNDPHPPSHLCIGPTLDDYAVVATMSMILPGVHVGEHGFVGAHSLVRKDVEPGTLVAGNPAKFICRTEEVKLRDGSGAPAYPWNRHFHRGYPEEVVAQWMKAFDQAAQGSSAPPSAPNA